MFDFYQEIQFLQFVPHYLFLKIHYIHFQHSKELSKKDKMKYQECIGRLHDIFGMVIRNLKSNISDSAGVEI